MFAYLCLGRMLIGMFKVFEKMFDEAFWKQTVMVFTRYVMKPSAIHFQLALDVNKTVCNTCCPVIFNSLRLDESQIRIIIFIEEMFGEAFWKQTVMVFTKLPWNLLQYIVS